MSHLPGADLEVRKHLWVGLDRLEPSGRVRFLKRLCKLVNFHGNDVKVTTHTGTVEEAWRDVMMLSFQHNLSLDRACAELETFLRRA